MGCADILSVNNAHLFPALSVPIVYPSSVRENFCFLFIWLTTLRLVSFPHAGRQVDFPSFSFWCIPILIRGRMILYIRLFLLHTSFVLVILILLIFLAYFSIIFVMLLVVLFDFLCFSETRLTSSSGSFLKCAGIKICLLQSWLISDTATIHFMWQSFYSSSAQKSVFPHMLLSFCIHSTMILYSTTLNIIWL